MTTSSPSHEKPIPEPDEATAPFFEAASRRVLSIPRCTDCRTWLAPGTTSCTECWSEALEWSEASGRATLYTFGLMHQPYHAAFELPYNLAEVELVEGPRLNSVVVGVPDGELRVGMALVAVFEAVAAGVGLVKFSRA